MLTNKSFDISNVVGIVRRQREAYPSCLNRLLLKMLRQMHQLLIGVVRLRQSHAIQFVRVFFLQLVDDLIPFTLQYMLNHFVDHRPCTLTCFTLQFLNHLMLMRIGYLRQQMTNRTQDRSVTGERFSSGMIPQRSIFDMQRGRDLKKVMIDQSVNRSLFRNTLHIQFVDALPSFRLRQRNVFLKFLLRIRLYHLDGIDFFEKLQFHFTRSDFLISKQIDTGLGIAHGFRSTEKDNFWSIRCVTFFLDQASGRFDKSLKGGGSRFHQTFVQGIDNYG